LVQKLPDELKSHGVNVGLVPSEYSSDGILETLRGLGVAGRSVYVPRTSGVSGYLAERLKEIGAEVNELYVYESRLLVDRALASRFLDDLRAGRVHAILFSSSLGARNFVEMFRGLVSGKELVELVNSRLTVVAIGPVTAEMLRGLGFKVDVVPERYVFEDALAALARFWRSH